MKLMVFFLNFAFVVSCTSSNKSGSTSADGRRDKSVRDEIGSETGSGNRKKTKKSDDSFKVEPSARKSKSDYSDLRRAIEGRQDREVHRLAAEFLARNEKDVKALNALAVHYLNSKRASMAKLYLKRAVDSGGATSAIHNNLGVIALMELDESLAVREFNKAISLDSGNLNARANIGGVLTKYENFQPAVKHLEKAYDGMRGDLRVGANYALALRGVGDYSEAQDVYESLIKKDSRNVQLQLNYAVLLVDFLKDAKKATEILNKIKFLSTDPGILEDVERLEKRTGGAGKQP